jgi:histidinol-phosphatase (PHP family)
MSVDRVSVHGGHSGQFCSHAKDTLEEVVQAYIAQGFAWVGLTEHMPPSGEAFLYPEERQAGLTAALMAERFVRYMAEARRLQKAYADRIDIRVAFESEDTPGAIDLARRLIAAHAPDYIVGSVHHIDGIPFDYSADDYARAVAACGGVEGLYCAYFDRQHDLVEQLRPQVVGHFDLIRIFDPRYRRHIMLPEVQKRIRRNLELIRNLDLILDYNVAALKKGAFEPYLCQPILVQARYLGIAVVPADDSHGTAQVGLHLDEGIRLLQQQGFDTHWRKPGIR